jgi:hypothetical protein
MKNLINILLLLFFITSYSQQKVFQKKKPTKGEANLIEDIMTDDDELGTISENISFGISVGFNNALEEISTASISPIDNKVIISEEQRTSFVLSTVLSVPIFFKRNILYRYSGKNGELYGPYHKLSEFSLIASLNIATFQGAQSGSVFNQKISGGLGVSYNFTEDVAIGLTYELLSYRKPKDFLINNEGTSLSENGNPVNSLDISDNRYFFDRYANTLSIKIIYKLTK